jgi:hypothetical protein
MNIIREEQVLLPSHDLPVRVMCVLGTEWGVSDETFEHDRSQGPPIARLVVTLLLEDLGGDVIRGSDRGVGLHKRFSESVNSSQIGSWTTSRPTSFRLLAFQVAICSLLLTVKLIELMATEFLPLFPVFTLDPSRSFW